ncbi:MAG: hypothetical protein N2Z72_08505 [Bacteroidales bacterium]|nr:hypothetical protein [Bacteroidales bacterium]
MKLTKYILHIVTLFLLSSCRTPQKVEDFLRKTNIFSDVWFSVESDIYYLEKWEHVDDSIKGITVIYSPKDTLYYEAHRIFSQHNQILLCSQAGKYIIQNITCLKLHKARKRKVVFKNEDQGVEYVVKKDYLILKSWIYTEDGKNIEKFKLYRKGKT